VVSVPSGVPNHLTIPALKVAADVVPVKVTSGLFGVPTAITKVGWWPRGGTPGAPRGTAVLDGHVDSATSGLGALWPLRSAEVGEQITLRLTSGNTVVYRVSGVRTYIKTALPASLFVGPTGPPALVLITCGGAFDRATGQYSNNTVVYAVPA
jgi:hypothetical protein